MELGIDISGGEWVQLQLQFVWDWLVSTYAGFQFDFSTCPYSLAAFLGVTLLALFLFFGWRRAAKRVRHFHRATLTAYAPTTCGGCCAEPAPPQDCNVVVNNEETIRRLIDLQANTFDRLAMLQENLMLRLMELQSSNTNAIANIVEMFTHKDEE